MKKLFIILFVLCFCVSTFGQFIPIKTFGQQLSGPFADGLVFWFRGIEAGEAVDESFLHNDGVITTTPWVADGLDFNGASGLVNCGTGASLANIWVNGGTLIGRVFARTHGEGDNGRILCKSTENAATNGWELQTRATNSGIAFLIANDIGGLSDRWLASMSLNVQHTIAVTYRISENIARIYIDGTEVPEDHDVANPAQTKDDDSALAFCIGNLPNQERTFDGIIADTKIYRRILSASEVLDLYINPDLPMEQEPIWLLFSPAAPSGIVPIIQAHTRRRRAG